ncbi:cation:proton antiporter regulatory subunit [Methanogenium cariaci]|uniref:cation:proton antiporter regulatory subunit n=1 Tax=Methanogenium cariaci TaxID=2197 RepID=UPI001FE152FB|nr:potassium transporter TrkA [Methanogenium cariaci]
MGFFHQVLPGIGTKYELETESGDLISVIFMPNGRVQLYTQPSQCPDCYAADLNPMETRRLGNVLTGAIMEAEEEGGVEIAFSALADLRIVVHTYIIHEQLSGKSITDLDIRSRTGVTVLAVSRGGVKIPLIHALIFGL